MARLPRITVPNAPHHVTQRGNRRQQVFDQADDYALYRDLLTQHCERSGVQIWSYCLMPNHVHLILVPATTDGISRAIGETHRRYAAYINARERVTGHLFQGRFGSVAMDENHLQAAVRYVAHNPVKANLVKRPQDWTWSSTPALLAGRSDGTVTVQPILDRIPNLADFLDADPDPGLEQALSRGQSIGRPLMEDERLRALEAEFSIRLRPKPRGRPARQDNGDRQQELR